MKFLLLKDSIAANGHNEAIEMNLNYTDDYMKFLGIGQVVVKETTSNHSNNKDGCLPHEHSHHFSPESANSCLEDGPVPSLARG